MNKKKNKVIILGAGPVGLVTGWLMSEKGWDVEIYELKNIIGGMCRTWKWNNFYLDTGPHIFHTDSLKLWNFWKDIFGKNLIKGEYWAKNVIGETYDRYVDYPLSDNTIKQLSLENQKKIKKEFKDKKHRKNLATNFKEQVAYQVGPTLQNLFYEGYSKKLWGIDTTEMTAEWAPKRIKFTKKSKPFFANEFTGVGKYGTGSLYEIIKKKIIKNKGKIFLNHRVTKINHQNNKINEICFDKKKSILINERNVIVSSLPITLTARLLGYKSNLKFRGVRSVYVALKKKRCFKKDYNWLYFSDPKIIFNRVSEPKTMSKFLCKENQTYLCVEIAYSKNDHIDQLSANNLSKIVIADLIKTKIIKKNDVIDTSENKEDFVYPVQFKNYKYQLSQSRSDISQFNQLYSMGTGGDFDYADSQILFHKSIDLANILTNKFSISTNVKKQTISTDLNSKVRLGSKYVGVNNPAFIIAEAGLNHNGDLNIAKKLIDEAVRCGCDAIKFQSYNSNTRVSSKVKSANYVEKADGLREDINEMFNRLSLDKNFHKKIFAYAKRKKILIFSTPFDENSVDLLEELNAPFYKIASVDAVNLPLIIKVGKTQKPLILSTGMCDISNVHDAVEAFKSTGNNNLILLHCLSSYPANENEMNLNAITTLKQMYKIPVGLSDHFPGNEITMMALGIGANIIERHFTLDKKLEGPDHILSSEPSEMKKIVKFCHSSNNIFGSGEKKIQPSEYEVINSQRKSLYAKNDIRRGEIFDNKNTCIKGPAGGILPKYLDLLIGKKSKNKISKDNPITWEDI